MKNSAPPQDAPVDDGSMLPDTAAEAGRGPAVAFTRRVPQPAAKSGVTTTDDGDEVTLAPDGDEDTPTRRGRGDKQKQPKGPKPMSPAARRRALDAERRKMRLGVRYGGDRWKRLLVEGALVFALILSVVALTVAANKPSKDQIASEVKAQLATSGLNFPSGEAVMWAGQALRVWGTWDESNPDTRAALLAPFLSQGMDTQAGWNGKGKQEVIYSALNPQPVASDANHAVISGAYQRADLTWACVGLPVYAYHPAEFSEDAPWAFALAGNPVPLACNPRTGAVPLPNTQTGLRNDADLARSLGTDFLPGFFSAWAASDANALTQYTASGVTTMGLGGAMASTPPPVIGTVLLPVDTNGVVEGKTYQATVPVTWTVNNSTSKVTATYTVPVAKRGDRWYVTGEPVAAPQAPEVTSGQPGSIPSPGNGVTPDPKTYPTPSTTTPSPAPSEVDPSSTGSPKQDSP